MTGNLFTDKLATPIAILLMVGGTPALSAGLEGGGYPGRERFAIAFTDVGSRDGRLISHSQKIVAAPISAFPEKTNLPKGNLQCVPYARVVSGIQLRGDAHTWWQQAAGRYERGFTPRVGAVMAFKPHGPMVLGHVATVSRVLDSHRVLLRHANWSPMGGQRGQIEDNVLAVDVSPRSDWSEVRVWYQPLGGLGTTHWPISGFIYNRPGAPAGPNHDSTRGPWLGDPIGAIIAAFSRR